MHVRNAGAETGVRAGEWRGLSVAIKTVIFQSGQDSQETAHIASEAAIASNLNHRNIVSTYHHDVCPVSGEGGNELAVYKFYLVQVPPRVCPSLADSACVSPGSRPVFAWRLHVGNEAERVG